MHMYLCTHTQTSFVQVEKKIGQGQFSVVYRAKNLVTGEIVALKKIQIFDMVDAKARQDCIKEIDLLKVNRLGRGLA